MKRMNFPGRKKTRREEAVTRQEARNGRSIQQQMELILYRPGTSKKETMRLLSQVKAEREALANAAIVAANKKAAKVATQLAIEDLLQNNDSENDIKLQKIDTSSPGVHIQDNCDY